MIDWISSQPLFMQIAAGIIAAALALILLIFLLAILLSIVGGISEWITSPRLEQKPQDWGPAIDLTSRDELIEVLMQRSGSSREYYEEALERYTQEQLSALANQPEIRFCIKKSRAAKASAQPTLQADSPASGGPAA